ncbi:MAG: DUF47 family protein [Candidatus Thermoplasmatota archaeon]
MGFKEWIIPQDKVFFDLLERHIALAGKCADRFDQMLAGKWSNVELARNDIKELESQADTVGHELFDRLNRTFITPIDREDIARLAHVIDDIADDVYAAANRLALHQIPGPTAHMVELVAILKAQVRELDDGVRSLRRPAQLKTNIPPHIVEIHRLENEADKVLNVAIGELFASNDPIRIMKYKEIYEFLEAATDRCEDVADVLQDILRKNG